jgi:hypothetical protein
MYGSFVNMIQDGVAPFEPEVGMGATILMWSDRRPVTIVEVLRYKTGDKRGQVRGVITTADVAKRVDTRGQSECQDYVFETSENGSRSYWTLRKDGRFRESGEWGGTTLRIGSRDCYRDPSF